MANPENLYGNYWLIHEGEEFTDTSEQVIKGPLPVRISQSREDYLLVQTGDNQYEVEGTDFDEVVTKTDS